jgi:hypothetical protein
MVGNAVGRPEQVVSFVIDVHMDNLIHAMLQIWVPKALLV